MHTTGRYSRDPIYIVLGNHRSVTGIQEIVNTVYGVLAKRFPVQLSSELKNNRVNVIIDEFSVGSDQVALKKTKELFPDTKLVLIATEFIMPVSVLGIELARTFNFFGRYREWKAIFLDVLRLLARQRPSYMHRRYLGFVRTLDCWDVIAVVHKGILPNLSKMLDHCENLAVPPLLLYPEIGELSPQQQNRLRTLPIGFTMSGTMTSYRKSITTKLVEMFRRIGWSNQIYKHVPFEAAPATLASLRDSQLPYMSIHPDYLFNLNPPQTSRWPFSSPMRILRAIYLGQIPVLTQKFGDHPLEDVAIVWDGGRRTALEVAAFTIRDRDGWLDDYKRSIAEYNRVAGEVNQPFIDIVTKLVQSAENALEGTASETSAIPLTMHRSVKTP